MHDLSTTLAAVATAPGRGGIGCVRISGLDAFAVARALIRSNTPVELPGRGRPTFVTFLGRDGEDLDHGYVVAFPAQRAFTGEPAVELWGHGSPPVLAALVDAAIAHGAKHAGPGEFTYRAVRHGRLDLSRAEAIRDLVAATTLHQARVAFAQVEGALARRLAPLRNALIDLVARTEAAIEFADEPETHLESGALERGLASAIAEISRLGEEARRGRVFREGARIALSGLTSVGKSSLFNRMLGADRAIVSPVAGTTRDTLEEGIEIGGIPIALVDTAGLRAAADGIEAEGVRRARRAAAEADLVLVVLDAGRPLHAEERAVLERSTAEAAPRIVVANKWDLVATAGDAAPWPGAIPVSALTGAGVEALREEIGKKLRGAPGVEPPAITHARHAAAIEAAAASLERARACLPLGDDIVLEELRDALAALGEITGDLANDELYDRIFSTFCIGK